MHATLPSYQIAAGLAARRGHSSTCTTCSPGFDVVSEKGYGSHTLFILRTQASVANEKSVRPLHENSSQPGDHEHLCAFAGGGSRTGSVGGDGSAAAARGADTPLATGAPVPGQSAAAAKAADTAALNVLKRAGARCCFVQMTLVEWRRRTSPNWRKFLRPTHISPHRNAFEENDSLWLEPRLFCCVHLHN